MVAGNLAKYLSGQKGRGGDFTLFTLHYIKSFFFFHTVGNFQVQPYNRKYRSIGHRVWSKSLNILTELSVTYSIVLNPQHSQ